MSDFDKFFAEKLEEEGDFPHRDRNWKQIAQRLHAFEMGGSGKPSLWHYWPAAVAVVVSLAVSGWLLWKMQAIQQENIALRQEIAVLRQSLPTGATDAPATTLPETNTSQTIVEEKNTTHSTRQNTPAASSQNSLKSSLPPASNPATATKKPLSKQKPANNKQSEKLPDAPLATTNNQLNPSTSIDSSSNQIADKLPELSADNEKQPAISTEAPPSSVIPDSTQINTIAQVQDSTQTIIAAQNQVVTPTPALLPPDSVATAATLPPVIKPVRQNSRFRMGVEGVTGKFLESEKGISPLLGSGVTASYSPIPSLRVMASADWLHFDVNTSSYVPQCHAPQHAPPMHMHPHDELVQVESQQRQQHFALGLAYALPVHGWLRPSVRLAHTWVRIAPGLVSFKFEEEPGPGGPHGPGHRDPEYVAQKFGSQTLSNIWRVGAGLEHELPRWTIGLWADYSKNLASAESTFDILSVRAGVQYKFN